MIRGTSRRIVFRPESEAPVEFCEAVDDALAALAGLPIQEAEAYWLREVDSLSTAEVAERLRLTSEQVEAGLLRAEQELRSALSGLYR
jgi:DNA-directed RNA polymerase specialized sigma24 family protein